MNDEKPISEYTRIITSDIDHPIFDYEYFNGNESDEDKQVCKKFGCGRKLSIREKLFGDYCIHHQRKEE